MIPWIQIYSNLPHHPKVGRLADELNLSSQVVNPNAIAVGILINLWTWAIQNAYDGDLSRCTDRTIADACQWKQRPDMLVSALITVGWIDHDRRLHDWEEYAIMLIAQEDEKKEKHREAARRYREKKKNHSDVTVTTSDPPKQSYGDPGLARVMQLYQNRISPLPPQTVITELTGFVKDMGPEVCEYAINYAIGEGTTKWSYIRGVLRGYWSDGVRNIDDLRRVQAEFDRQKEAASANNSRNSARRSGGAATKPAGDPLQGFHTE